MKEEKETKKLLIKSAKSEFMKKGFEKASLRTICKNAGVTTGALYFFFNNKEDLFSAIVEEPYNLLMQTLLEHFRDEHETVFSQLSEPFDFQTAFVSEQHKEIEYKLIHTLYSNYDAFLLIIEKSQGTRFENCIDNCVELIEKSYVFMAEEIAKSKSDCKVNKYMCHWLTHITIDSFIHLLTHVNDEELALKYARKIIEFMLNGWIESVLFENE